MYKEILDGAADAAFRTPEQDDILDTQQRDEDEGGSHCLHVGSGLGAVCLLQLRDQNTDDVQEEEEVHLCKERIKNILQPPGVLKNLLHLCVYCDRRVKVAVHRRQKQNSSSWTRNMTMKQINTSSEHLLSRCISSILTYA